MMKYSEEQVRSALELYLETRSVTKTIRMLGLQVSRAGFYKWIKKARALPAFEGFALSDTLDARTCAFYLLDPRAADWITAD